MSESLDIAESLEIRKSLEIFESSYISEFEKNSKSFYKKFKTLAIIGRSFRLYSYSCKIRLLRWKINIKRSFIYWKLI